MKKIIKTKRDKQIIEFFYSERGFVFLCAIALLSAYIALTPIGKYLFGLPALLCGFGAAIILTNSIKPGVGRRLMILFIALFSLYIFSFAFFGRNY